MSRFPPPTVKTLRDRTNVPMMECKAALTEAGGDMDKAVEILRKKNKDVAGQDGRPRDRRGPHRRLHRPGQEGRRHRRAALRERRRSPRASMFVKLANDLAKQVALKEPATRRGAAGPAVRRRPEARRSTTASARWSA